MASYRATGAIWLAAALVVFSSTACVGAGDCGEAAVGDGWGTFRAARTPMWTKAYAYASAKWDMPEIPAIAATSTHCG